MAAPGPLEVIELAERAYKVWEKCRSAKGDYKELADHVNILSNAINEAKRFVEDEGIPPDAPKVTSLQSAYASCGAVLEEVDVFLKKNSGINSLDRKRYFEIAKFIFRDVDSLKAKLSHCTSFLQLGLQSLNALSMSEVRKTLEIILKEYRGGIREPSVLSHAIVDNQAVQSKELMEQLKYDLEDKDVHPDAIALNGSLISTWLNRIVKDGGFEETLEQKAFSPITPLDKTPSYDVGTPAMEWQEPQSDDIGLGIHKELSPSSETGRSLPPVDEMESSSRPGSAHSHQSQPEDWHPYNRPSPEYVYAMLDDYLQCNYTNPPSLSETRLRIIRAFNQQDWSHRGNLTRPEVIQLCSQVLQRAGVRHQGELIRKRVLMADRNRDGQLDKLEFIELIDGLIQLSAEVRGNMVNEQLNSLSQSLQENEEHCRELITSKAILPWKWTKQDEHGAAQYIDELTNNKTSTEPPGGPSRDSFTIMALEADVCVEKISDFKQHWLGIVPQSLQSKFLEALDAIYVAAIKFTTFELASDERQLSDFDVILTCYKILSKTGREGEIHDATTLIPLLEEARKSSRVLLSLVQGVCWRLMSFSMADFDATAQNFPQFQKRWAKSNIDNFARQITRRFADETVGWTSIHSIIDRCLRTNILTKVEEKAIQAAHSYIGSGQDELSRLRATEWSGDVSAIRVHMANVSRVLMGLVDDKRRFYVHISVDAPEQEIQSSPEKGAQATTWNLGNHISLNENSCIKVSVFEQRGQSDVLFYEFPSVAPLEYNEDGKALDFAQRQPGLVKLRCRAEGYSWSIHVVMEDQRATAREMSRLASCSWMDLLGEKEVPTQELPVIPKMTSRRSSRMSPRTTSDGTSSVVSQESRTSTWESMTSSAAINGGKTKIMQGFKKFKGSLG